MKQKNYIQNILYAAHCIGVCSDWSEQTINEILEMLNDKEYQYNKNTVNEYELNKLAYNYAYNHEDLLKLSKLEGWTDDKLVAVTYMLEDAFKAGYTNSIC